MKDKKAIKHLNKLGEYCSDPERVLCEGYVFRNIRYKNRCSIALALYYRGFKKNQFLK